MGMALPWFLSFKLTGASLPTLSSLAPVHMKPLGGVLGASEELWFLKSQRRKNSVRGKVIDKKWFIRMGRLWGLPAGRWEGAIPRELSGLQFYNQRKVGRGKRPLSASFLSRHQTSIISFSSRVGRGVFSCLHGQASRDCPGTMEKLFQVSVQWESFTLKCHLSINYCFFMCAKSTS